MQSSRYTVPALLLVLLLCGRAVPAEKNSTEYYNEGLEYAKSGRLDVAEETFRKTITVNKYYCLGHYGLGRVYMYKPETIGKAITHLKKAVELDTNYAPAYFYLGIAQLVTEKYVDSIHSFSKAFEKDNRFVEALYNIGTVYELLGDEYNAFFYYRKYLYEREKLNRSPF
ncbi:MAG TPA: tetratricopeptide repeat protein [Spirochaetota bacterium]|nr:tetratricopeptide repeat protein [Spirochaetota bacterium]